MKDKEDLYICVLYNLITNLKGKFDFLLNNIDYDNVELILEKSSIEGIDENYFSIAFQKQNGSFTLIINGKISEILENKIIAIISESIEIDLFASYNFHDMPNIYVKHWCYDEERMDFNKDLLNQFNKMGEIKNLTYHPGSEQTDISKSKI